MKVIELFAGIGAPHMALIKNNINVEMVGISEIEKSAIEMYNIIHGETKNFGDITKIKSLPYCDFLHFSSPCQSFSRSGKHDGIKGESGLIYEVYRLMDDYYKRKELPKYISFENVPPLKTDYPEIFNELLNNLTKWGYNYYEDILSATNYGNPTKRDRLFVIGIRKDIDTKKFSMPNSVNSTNLRIKDFIDDKVDEKYNWPHKPDFHPATRKPNLHSADGWLDTGCHHSTQSNRVYNLNACCPTITRQSPRFWIKQNDVYRRLTQKELWLIQGFSLEDYNKICNNYSESKINAVTGNSIALGPLTAIYKNLKEAQEL